VALISRSNACFTDGGRGLHVHRGTQPDVGHIDTSDHPHAKVGTLDVTMHCPSNIALLATRLSSKTRPNAASALKRPIVPWHVVDPWGVFSFVMSSSYQLMLQRARVVSSVVQLESGLLLDKMGDPSLGKGDGLKKDREEEDVQPPSKATTTGEESALSPSAESSKGAHGGSPKEESRKTDGKNAEEIASQPVQMPEPEELPALQSEEMPESVPAPMRPSSRNSHVSKTSKNSSMRGKKAGIQKRERVYAQKMPSDAVHQAMEDGRSTPPLPPTATTPPASTSGSTNSSATRWNASAHKVAIDSAKTNLFVTLTRTDNDNAPKTAALNLATAQRLVLAGYQHQITETLYKAITLEDKDDAADELRLLNTQLHEYCKSSFP